MRTATTVAVFLAFLGILLAFASGVVWVGVIGVGAGMVIVLFRRLARTFAWAGIAAYASLIMPPHGWFIVLIGCIVCMAFPLLHGITPIADFTRGKKR